MEVKQRRKPGDLTDAIAQLILSREGERLWLPLASGWEKWVGGVEGHIAPIHAQPRRSLLGPLADCAHEAEPLVSPRREKRRAGALLAGSVAARLGLPPRVTHFLTVSKPPPLHEHLTQEFRPVASWRIRPARCDERGA